MEAPQTAPPATPETVWAILRELAASQKETDRAIKEFTAGRREGVRHEKLVVDWNILIFTKPGDKAS